MAKVTSIRKMFQTAMKHYQNEQFNKAAEVTSKILKSYPEHIEALQLLGDICYKAQDYDHVTELFRMIQASKPHNAQLLNVLGNILHEGERMDEAVVCFQQAIALDPSLAEAHYNLGVIYTAQERLDEAVAHYQQAIALDPGLAEAHYNLGVICTAQGRLDEAVAHYQQAIALDPGLAEAHYNMGKVFEAKGQTEKSVSLYEKALKLNPHQIEMYDIVKMILHQKQKTGMKFNIIISKRGRGNYLMTCLHYLNAANADCHHDVEIHISSDDDETIVTDNFQNIKIFSYAVPQKGKFNRSRLLNHSIMNARKDFDIMTVMDLDMIYDDKFFDIILYQQILHYDYITCYGYKLPRDESEYIIQCLDTLDTVRNFKKEIFPGASQISINRKAYNELLKSLGRNTLYNEYYEGWGCEDTELSMVSEILHKECIIHKTYINGVWHHLWHERECDKSDFDKELYDSNFRYLREFLENFQNDRSLRGDPC